MSQHGYKLQLQNGLSQILLWHWEKHWAVKTWSKKKELRDLSTIIDPDWNALCFRNNLLQDIHIYYQQELKSIYMCQDVSIGKNITYASCEIYPCYDNVYGCTSQMRFAVLFFHGAALLEKIRSFDGIDWFWYIVESLWTFSNLQGAPLPALPLPIDHSGKIFCTYIYAVKWNVDWANESFRKAWYKIVMNTI